MAVLAETNAKDMLAFRSTNESALQEILQHLERIVRDYVTKDELDISIKQMVRGGGSTLSHAANSLGSGGGLLSMDQSQYRKVLELMLELERKIENRVEDVSAEMRREVNKMSDERQLRQELAALVEEKLVEAFDPRATSGGTYGKMVARVEVIEKAYD